MKFALTRSLFLSALVIGFTLQPAMAARGPVAVAFPGPKVGTAQAIARGGWQLGNNIISAHWTLDGGVLALRQVRDELNHKTVAFANRDLFALVLADGGTLRSSQLKITRAPRTEELLSDVQSTRFAESTNGMQLTAQFAAGDENLQVEWRAILRDGSPYIRQELALRVRQKPLKISEITLLDDVVHGAKVIGYTDGAPLATDHLFLGVEHPMAKNSVSAPTTPVAAWLPADVQAGQLRIPLGAAPDDGVFKLRFQYERGNHRLDISQVTLLDGNAAVATDKHAGFSGNANANNEYSLKIPKPRAGANYVAVAQIGSDAGTDSYGSVFLQGGTSRVRGALPRFDTLAVGQEWCISSVIGVYAPGQLRRTFASYIERERAHPYRQYFHYNSWYDLNIGRNDNPDPLMRMTEADALAVMDAIGSELIVKRGVKLDGYVWDDGWDDFQTLWDFHKGFPNGFTSVAEKAKTQGAGIGAWLSPWGGYGGSKNQRVNFGRQQGFEIKEGGFTLAGPKYYATFRDRCRQMIRDYNMNYFKFDGIGAGTMATGAPPQIAADLDGLTRLIGELRQARADIFINCTVGTWASPFWVLHADSIWRGGDDHGSAGAGDGRNQWMNYRDSVVYDRFASRSPLYPLNSLMTHGLLISDRAGPGRMPRDIGGIRAEIRTAIGGGTGLQELYISPRIMTAEMWDALTESINWGRANADVLADTHWTGGDPRKAEVYGYASWHPRKGIIVLRNPTNKPQSFALDVNTAFELPLGAAQVYHLKSPFADAPRELKNVRAGVPQNIEFAPFEVVVLEATPT